MKLLRLVGIGLNVLVGLVVVALGFVGWLAGTESGSAVAVRHVILPRLPGIVVSASSGTLLDRLILHEARFESPAVQAVSERLELEFDWRQLPAGRLVFRDLFAAPVAVTIEAPADGSRRSLAEWLAAGIAPPALGVGVVVESAVAAGITVTTRDRVTDLGQVTLAGELSGADLDIRRLGFDYQGFDLSAQGQVRLGAAVAVAGTLSAAGAYDGRDVLVSAQVDGQLPTLAVDAELLEPAALRITGRVDLDTVPAFDLDVEWEALDPGSFGLPLPAALAIGAGRADLGGDMARIELGITAGVTVAGESLELSASGAVAGSLVEIGRLQLARDGAVVVASGSIDVANRAFALRVDGDDLDPALFVPDWPGRVQAGADVDGAFRPSEIRIASRNVELAGMLRGYPFAGSLSGIYRGADGIDVDRAELSIGSNVIEASGAIGAGVSLDVAATLADLAELHDAVAGAATARFTVSGSLGEPQFDGVLTGQRLTLAGVGAESIEIAGHLGLRADAEMELTVRATGPTFRAVALTALTAGVSGTAASHAVELDASAPEWSASGGVRGSLDGMRAWQGTLDTLQFLREPFGQWRLRDQAALMLTRSSFEMGSACLLQEAAEVCFGISIGGESTETLQLSATDFDIALLDPFLPPALDARGRYDLEIDLTDFRSSPVGRAQLTGSDLAVRVATATDDAVDVRIASVELMASGDAAGFSGTLEIHGAGTDRINAAFTGAAPGDRNAPFSGNLELDWADVAILSLLSENVGAVTGRITADVTLGGSLAAPEFGGRAVIADGRIDLPIWGVVADGISATAVSPDGRSLAFTATGLVDGNELRLTGTTALDPGQGWPTRLRLRGDSVELVQVADADIVVSPDLEIAVDFPTILVRGEVFVPSALIQIEELPSQAVRPSPDSVVHGIVQPERRVPVILDADIELRLGDDVRYEGAGLNADLAGALRLQYSTLTSTAASGTLSILGTYEQFGQELTLERGELIFTGPLDDPTLNVRAVRRVDTITVGIDLTGTLRAPVSRIFSEPVMAEADALSYLLFGRPLAVPDGGDPNQLRNAAVSLGLRQAVPVIQRIGDSLGFDEFAIESTEVDTGELMAGKYLSPRLYVRYSYGLFNRIGGLLLQYRLNERLSIETRSGDQKSMDVLYTIEKE